MNKRSNSYLGTFVNNEEGISSYKLMVHHIRQVVTGGRFLKMFRGNSRNYVKLQTPNGKTWKYYSGCSKKGGATHFDVYLMPRSTKKGWELPKFYNFVLQSH